MSKQRILITGGLGYLGGRIANFLNGFPKTNIILGTRRKFSEIPDWAKSFQITNLNLCDTSSISDAIVNLDTVIHLAGLDEQNSFRDIEAAWKINALGTQSLLSVANDKGIQKFIYFSTFHVYGDCEGTITEETPAQPYHPYASTHRAAEDIVRFYQHYKNINTLTLRLSNAFGCPMDTEINRWALVFNDLCRQAMTSRKMIINSSGKQYRNFISLHDVCAAIEHFLYAIPDQWGDGLYNLGGDNCLSIIEVAEIIAKVYKSKYGESIPVQINDKDDEKKYNPVHFNINKLKKTGFSLSGNMEKEIEKTLSLCEKFAA